MKKLDWNLKVPQLLLSRAVPQSQIFWDKVRTFSPSGYDCYPEQVYLFKQGWHGLQLVPSCQNSQLRQSVFLGDFISRHCAFKSISQTASNLLSSLLPSPGCCHQSVYLPVHHAHSKGKRQSSNWKRANCTLRKWHFSGIDEGISCHSVENGNCSRLRITQPKHAF
jgi:hypothetical protein